MSFVQISKGKLSTTMFKYPILILKWVLNHQNINTSKMQHQGRTVTHLNFKKIVLVFPVFWLIRQAQCLVTVTIAVHECMQRLLLLVNATLFPCCKHKTN